MKLCHKYVYAARKAIYICAKDSSFTSNVDMLNFDPNLRKVMDTSVMVRVFKADTFKVSEQDFTALKGYTPEEEIRYQDLGMSIAEASKNTVN